MAEGTLTVAIVHEVFHGEHGDERLRSRLAEAREAGAELALLPELPLHPWIPAGRQAHDEDAEPPEGPRHRTLAEAARAAGIGVHGGAIVRESSGKRYNRALLFDASGTLVGSYDKMHVPCEEGFWEADHYLHGESLPRLIETFGMPLGLQICSDVQRPAVANALGASGAELIVAPRATPGTSYERWNTVLRALAMSSVAYVISVNRPGPERGVPIGGASIAVAPDGRVVAEATDPLTTIDLERGVVARARQEYPGYLDVRSDLYVRAWTEVSRRQS
jgi:predicted amidohydrolase